MQISKLNNMKKLLYICIAIGLFGCKKSFLEQNAYVNNIQSNTYYNTVSEVESATAVQYSFIDYNDWWQTQWWRTVSGEAASDNAWIGVNGGQGTAVQAAHYTLNAENDRVEAHWIMSYKGIFSFNATIEGIEKSTIDATAKNRAIAELKFLRAFMYWDLVRNWGDVPLITKTLSPAENTYSRTSAAEVYRFIKQDLNDAIQVLPRKSEYAAANKFRVSKGAAQALLAKLQLYTDNWTEAAALADQVISSGDFSLEPAFGNIWSMTNYNGRESIFETQFQFSVQYPSIGNYFPTTAMSPAESGWGYFTPTSDLENAFKEQGDSTRLNWTIMRHNFPVAGDAANPKFDARPASEKSARFNRKIYIPRAERTAGGRFSKDVIHLRLADVYLIKAEAAAMLMQNGPALTALKAVRDRVGLSTDMSLSSWALIEAVRKERRLEMALEGDRLFDLRRWKDQAGVAVINKVMGPTGSFVIYNTTLSTDRYEKGNSNEAQNKGFSFTPGKHNLWPIPSKEIIASEGRILQNPGY
jgi:hypothetical protein